MKSVASSAKKQLIWGIILTAFFGYAVVSALTGEELKDGLITYIACLIPSLWLLYSSTVKRIRSEKATRLSQVFLGDNDGIVPAEQLANVLGTKNNIQAIRQVEKLIGLGLLQNCTVDYANTMKVVLRQADNGGMMEPVVCPSCGAKGQRRKGYAYQCPFCDTTC